MIQKVDLPEEEHKWEEEDEASLTTTKSEAIDLTDTSKKLGAEREVV